eukprot:c14130_g2_i1 orf=192-455(-)
MGILKSRGVFNVCCPKFPMDAINAHTVVCIQIFFPISCLYRLFSGSCCPSAFEFSNHTDKKKKFGQQLDLLIRLLFFSVHLILKHLE